MVCGSPPPVHAHHLRHSEKKGVGQKVSDKWVVPLCWKCHASCHTRGKEAEWWKQHEIEPLGWATERYEVWNEGRNKRRSADV